MCQQLDDARAYATVLAYRSVMNFVVKSGRRRITIDENGERRWCLQARPTAVKRQYRQLQHSRNTGSQGTRTRSTHVRPKCADRGHKNSLDMTTLFHHEENFE